MWKGSEAAAMSWARGHEASDADIEGLAAASTVNLTEWFKLFAGKSDDS